MNKDGGYIEIDMLERIKNMTPEESEFVQETIVDAIRKEALCILQESKYEDVMRPHLVKNHEPHKPFFQVGSYTRRAYGLQLGDSDKVPMPHQLSQEKILYYTGVDHTRIVEENYAKNPWPNVGTIGHCDHPYSLSGPYGFETPLFYAIKQAITKL